MPNVSKRTEGRVCAFGLFCSFSLMCRSQTGVGEWWDVCVFARKRGALSCSSQSDDGARMLVDVGLGYSALCSLPRVTWTLSGNVLGPSNGNNTRR